MAQGVEGMNLEEALFKLQNSNAAYKTACKHVKMHCESKNKAKSKAKPKAKGKAAAVPASG